MLPYKENDLLKINTDDINNNRERFLMLNNSFVLVRDEKEYKISENNVEIVLDLANDFYGLNYYTESGNLGSRKIKIINDTNEKVIIPKDLEGSMEFRYNNNTELAKNQKDLESYKFLSATFAVGAKYLGDLPSDNILNSNINNVDENSYKSYLLNNIIKAGFEVSTEDPQKNGELKSDNIYYYPLTVNISDKDIVLNPGSSTDFSISYGNRTVAYVRNFFQNTDFAASLNIPLKQSITLTFVQDDGSTSELSVIKDSKNSVTPPTPIAKAGYRFLGWFDNKGNNLSSYTSFSQATTFTAKYEKIEDIKPIGKDITVELGGLVKPEDGISNLDKLPKGTSVAFEKTPDTSKTGLVKARLVVTYPNGEKVFVDINNLCRGKNKWLSRSNYLARKFSQGLYRRLS